MALCHSASKVELGITLVSVALFQLVSCIQFNATEYTVRENDGSTVVCLEANANDLENDIQSVEATVSTTSGSAGKPGMDGYVE